MYAAGAALLLSCAHNAIYKLLTCKYIHMLYLYCCQLCVKLLDRCACFIIGAAHPPGLRHSSANIQTEIFIIIFRDFYVRYIAKSFYPRDAMLARVIAIATCLSVRPSVCPSHAGIVSKRRKLASRFLHHLVAPRF